ncbi:CynX/NimT family MFS transporter [Solirhodobacter olei]|uniref:MFS transporter n=1 Tax=Solirhodobacter olei TaxID=2493082 RepID=UPI000FDA856D|nr:MFS transporter [Solirhodobacter olei]
MATSTNWRAILLAYAIGVVGAVQVGRVAPATTQLRDTFSMNLATLGWAISTITLASAVFGVVAGLYVRRRGARVILVLGAATLAFGVLASVLVPAAALLILVRAVEGMGYLAIVVAAPTLIADQATLRSQPAALALWGTFFTLGLSLAAIAGGTLAQAWGWRGWFAANGALVAMVTAVGFLLLPSGSTEPLPADREDPKALGAAAWLLGGSFLGLTLLSLSILSMMPTFLIEAHGFSSAQAGSATGLIALASIAGSLVYGLLGNRTNPTAPILAATFLLIASALPAFESGFSAGTALAAASIAVFATGILMAFTFGAVPRLVRHPSQIGPANGLIAQLGSIGAFLGPPAVGALVSRHGWGALSVLIVGFTVTFVGLALAALTASRATSLLSR